MDFPYRAEYAKSSRASCRSCKSSIQKEALRLAAMVQSSKFDGRTPQWYHFDSFFGSQRPKIVDDIENFEEIRWEDQEKIKDKIKNMGSIIVPAGKGKKRAASDNGALKDFTLEYSKSSRAMCRGCQQKIMKDEVRISKKDFESEAAKKYNGQDMWHHLTCFAKLRSELGYFECGDKLPGFKSMKKSDQDEVIKEIPAIKQENGSDIKKVKKDEEDPLDKELIKQNKKMYMYKDNLKTLKKSELQLLLEANTQVIPPGEAEILNRLADVMTFGTLRPCPDCREGQLVFNKDGYYCQGDATEWAKCNGFAERPNREKFLVPDKLAEKYSFLQKYSSSVKHRIFKKVTPTAKVVKKDDEEDDKPKIQREVPPLYDMQFILEVKKNKDALKKEIMNLGGSVVTKISEKIMAVISTSDQVEKMGSRMSSIKDADIQVVSSDFVKKAKEYRGRIPELILNKSICDWGSDPTARLPAEPSVSYKSKSKSMYAKSGPSTVKLKLKGGTAVDPESKLDHKSHVYQDGNDKYTVILGLTDIQKNKNSYYKLQVLEADNRNEYWLFRSWGRTGTNIGGNKVEPQSSLHDAIQAFETLYEEKTGNEWEYRHEFTKVPGRMYPIEVDYDDEDNKLDITNTIESKLPGPVQKLMQLIFNVKIMKDLMLEFELDTDKMPLGKLSVNQMKKAFDVLSELQQLIENKGSKTKLIDASNRFYTYVPHSFGIKELPIIENEEQIRQKTEMIENLMEVEFAYNLMKSSGSGIDGHYAELNTEIGVLARDSKEFKTIEKYVKNTHASTHNTYELEIIEIFTVKRSGEEKRFKPFKKMHNRQLLWHGSRVTNFAGILKQGLRIAPPNAPTTGYMFGKGIYFADMVSKSANYCCTMAKNPTGLLLLCDVALGNMYERSKADYIQKLPTGKHSCKGVGSTYPDEKEKIKLGDVDVPLGKAVNDTKLKSDLLYNEYIVYDIAQVNVKYLLQLNFKYKF
ncbi:PREDICTED: poly [ADP-ribose] polymerase [Nicrophorus vespilloides]|uniref:Poly [ADP-ribose] polymerase n=1 Tax=Nicrophorus vespilloides TaxID=110193 RepID=A0ABM1MVA5_NICVS|nr:PREDICTED: poly [ADP-ribose] polymerase [Nicrophorus vespilloides]